MFEKRTIAKYSINGVEFETDLLDRVSDVKENLVSLVKFARKHDLRINIVFGAPIEEDTDYNEVVAIQSGGDPFDDLNPDSITILNQLTDEEHREDFRNSEDFESLLEALLKIGKPDQFWEKE